MLNEIRTIKQDAEKELIQITPQLLDMVIERWKSGKGVRGGLIGEYQSYDYALFKNRLNPAAGMGNVDLINTGDLKDGLFIKKEGNLFNIVSRDKKYQMIANKYGAEEFGLTDAQMQETLAEIKLIVLEDKLKRIYE